MKWLIRIFFRTVRRILGPVMLLVDKITTPKGIKRTESEQHKLDLTTQNYALYQFKTCPFCIKVRREIKRQSLNIELRDAQHDADYRQQLLQGGGQVKVPCLRIQDKQGQVHWLYESDKIIEFLRQQAA
jgi:glutaredoxin